ncbi:unnamed protein product, partial [Symbiodinium sp. CCMP2456]
ARGQLHRTITAAAVAAEELEKDRLRLAQFLGHDITALSDVFSFLAQGRQGFTLPDFRRALTHLQLRASERDLYLIWQRYAQPGDGPRRDGRMVSSSSLPDAMLCVSRAFGSGHEPQRAFRLSQRSYHTG